MDQEPLVVPIVEIRVANDPQWFSVVLADTFARVSYLR